ncbi:MAG TPA: chromate efflux transporter [Acidimicrobiales bacterium]|nr:chromate efflux transporter [Acidimicrobiales bacterium]
MTAPGPRVGLSTVALEWGRIGVLGFGGPPAHISLLRALCVERRAWLTPKDFEDGIAATNLLPGPASTQLAIFCAWRVAGVPGAVLGGLAFICPGLAIILVLAALFLQRHPPLGVLGAASGAGAAVPAVALAAALALLGPSWSRAGTKVGSRARWTGYLALGAVAAATVGPYLVLVIAGCGTVELLVRRPRTTVAPRHALLIGLRRAMPLATGGLGAVAWVAFKVGALSYGGGFVIVPLMQHDAVSIYHWMTPAQFLDAVALGQVTPGPVVQTVAVVGYAAGGIGGGLLAALVAFAPSFAFIILLSPHFDRLRASRGVQAFLTGAGSAAIGAIAGAAVPLGLALSQWWQLGVLAAAAVWLLALRRAALPCLLGAGVIGAIAALAGAPVAH